MERSSSSVESKRQKGPGARSGSRLGAAPHEFETFCDVAEALYLVNSQDADPEGVILDCLLVFDDLVRATKLHMPDRYQGMLTELAARLTEGASLRKIFPTRRCGSTWKMRCCGAWARQRESACSDLTRFSGCYSEVK